MLVDVLHEQFAEGRHFRPSRRLIARGARVRSAGRENGTCR